MSIYPAYSLAAQYYIDKNHPQASDSNPGTEASPWQNPWKLTTTTLSPGDTVYIKAGTYTMTQQSWASWNCPNIHPRQSGTSSSPITIRNYPGDSVTLDRGSLVAPMMGTCSNYPVDYVVFDGFNFTNALGGGVTVYGSSESSPADHITVQNMNITFNPLGCTGTLCICDNMVGFRVEFGTNLLFRNNKVHDIWNSCRDNNGSGVQMYWSQDSVFEYNEIYNVHTAFYSKTAMESVSTDNRHVIRYNYIHDVAGDGIRFSGRDGQSYSGDSVYMNIVAGSTNGVTYKDTVKQNNQNLYNNTFYKYSECSGSPSSGSTGFKSYNNICDKSGTAYMFVGPLTTAAGFNLQPGSPAIGAGTSDGTDGGTPVNLGAYRIGNECIGLESQCASQTPRPTAPTGLRIVP